MGVKFTPIVNNGISTYTMAVKFTPIVDDIAYYGGEEVFLCYPEMLYPVWKKIGMSKFLIHHSWHITTSPLMA